MQEALELNQILIGATHLELSPGRPESAHYHASTESVHQGASACWNPNPKSWLVNQWVDESCSNQTILFPSIMVWRQNDGNIQKNVPGRIFWNNLWWTAWILSGEISGALSCHAFLGPTADVFWLARSWLLKNASAGRLRVAALQQLQCIQYLRASELSVSTMRPCSLLLSLFLRLCRHHPLGSFFKVVNYDSLQW